MPINPSIVQPKSRDRGAAFKSVDLERRVRSLEGKYGVVGAGTTITGARFQTAISGAHMVMQGPGPTPSKTFPQGEGLFVFDSNGHTVIGVTPSDGLTFLYQSADPVSRVKWAQAALDGVGYGPTLASVVAFDDLTGDDHISMQITSYNPADQTNYAKVSIVGYDSGDNVVQASSHNGFGTKTAILLDQNGCAKWPGGVSCFNKATPVIQPSTPSTLSGVISILQQFGFCS